MTTLVADSTGKLAGEFRVPENIPVGTKKVEFIGSGGSYGWANYTGRGTTTLETWQRIRQITTVRWWVRSDPLAQTFMLNESRHIGGCDVWFVVKGTTPVRAQIRETELGMPNQIVLAEGQITPDDINLEGESTRITFPPVWLEADREYALVLLTDDAEHAVAVAEASKYDKYSKKWVTEQPYQVGVLLSSSNASTWTPHQKKDLAFRLLACEFSETTRDVLIGEVEADEVSDILAIADVERTGSDTDIEWIAKNGDSEIRLQEGQPINLQESITGTYQIIARLKGSQKRSPVLYPGVQAVLGKIRKEANYISRAARCGDEDSKITVTFEANTPGQSNINTWLEVNGEWTVATFESAEPTGDGWEERVYTLIARTFETRAKLHLTGNASARPRARNLRMVITDA